MGQLDVLLQKSGSKTATSSATSSGGNLDKLLQTGGKITVTSSKKATTTKPTPIVTQTPIQKTQNVLRQVKQNPIVKTAKDIFATLTSVSKKIADQKTKNREAGVVKAQKAIAKIPSPNLGTKYQKKFQATDTETKVMNFITNFPSEVIKGFGENELPILYTKKGNERLKKDAINLPNTMKEAANHIKNKEWMKALEVASSNSAVIIALDAAGFIPVGKILTKGVETVIGKKAAQQIVKDTVEQAAKKELQTVSARELGFKEATDIIKKEKPKANVSKAGLYDTTAEKFVKNRNPDLKFLSIFEDKNSIVLEKIESKIKNKGIGTKAMQDLFEYADAKNKSIDLVPATAKADNFFGKRGFRVAETKNGHVLTRNPRVAQPTSQTAGLYDTGKALQPLKDEMAKYPTYQDFTTALQGKTAGEIKAHNQTIGVMTDKLTALGQQKDAELKALFNEVKRPLTKTEVNTIYDNYAKLEKPYRDQIAALEKARGANPLEDITKKAIKNYREAGGKDMTMENLYNQSRVAQHPTGTTAKALPTTNAGLYDTSISKPHEVAGKLKGVDILDNRGNDVGYIDYFVNGNTLELDMIRIKNKEFRNKGNAAKALDQLMKQTGTTKVSDMGATTQLGRKFLKSFKPRVAQPTIGEVTKTPSKIALSVKQKALDQGITDNLELAGYSKQTIAGEKAKAFELAKDSEKFSRVLRGEETANINPSTIIKMAEDHIKNTGDAKMVRDLANSPLISETSKSAQVLRMAAEREPDSLTARLMEVRKAKEEAFKNKYKGQKLPEVQKKVVADIKSKVKKPDKYDWNNFVNSIQC